MIVFPKEWNIDYSKFVSKGCFYIEALIDKLTAVLNDINVYHLAYSGGIDSTILLHILSESLNVGTDIHTYTISSRVNNPDIIFSRKGSELYGTIHHEFIVQPTFNDTDKFIGDNAVRQFYGYVSSYTDRILCGDGIDEFMCGYYNHQNGGLDKYKFYLKNLTNNHLIPLHESSRNVKVYLPYLDNDLISIYKAIPLSDKVTNNDRKIIIQQIARKFKIPEEFIVRNKYGFCDAFVDKNK